MPSWPRPERSDLLGTPSIVTVAGGIADPDTAERVVAEAVQRFGRIDTLINNAGLYIGKPFTDYTLEDFNALDQRQPRWLLSHHDAHDRAHGRPALPGTWSMFRRRSSSRRTAADRRR